MRPLIHVGYHKTGTTWLQQVVFRAEASAFYSPWDWMEPVRRIVLPDPYEFDAGPVRERFEREFEAAADRVPCVSCERFTGNPMSGGYDRKEVAERLAAVFPGARILIVIREQRSMILSAYRQFVLSGGLRGLARFMNPGGDVDRIPMFDLAYFRYDGVIRQYRQLFGDESVLVLPFERFRKNRPEFLSAIMEFAGAGAMPEPLQDSAHNRGYCAFTMAGKRAFNLFFVGNRLNPVTPIRWQKLDRAGRVAFRWLDGFVPGPVRRWGDARLKGQIERATEGVFEESNRAVAEMTGLDLAAYGYSMPPGGSPAAGKEQ
jgi:hypothetical protein